MSKSIPLGALLGSHVHLLSLYPSQHGCISSVINSGSDFSPICCLHPTGTLCKISGRLLSSSLRFTVILLLILIFKKVSTSRWECQDTGLSVCPFCRPCGMAFPSGISLLYRSPFYKYSSALFPSPILLILVSSPFSDRKSKKRIRGYGI